MTMIQIPTYDTVLPLKEKVALFVALTDWRKLCVEKYAMTERDHRDAIDRHMEYAIAPHTTSKVFALPVTLPRRNG